MPTDAPTNASSSPPAGWVTREQACQTLGVSLNTLMRWDQEGRVRRATWWSGGKAGRSRVYPVEEIERLKGEIRQIHSTMPEGFVDRDGACRMFGVAEGTWVVWEREGKVPKGQWGRARTKQPCRIYSIKELRRVMEQMRSPDKPYRKPGRSGTYQVPDGFLRQREAARMFGVDIATWQRWEQEGKITCGDKIHTTAPKLYPKQELEQMLTEHGKYQPPYPDPQRPGVYRVPLAGHDIHRREAIIDAADLPLVEGERWTWSQSRPEKPGQVVISRAGGTARLRQVIMGVSGTKWRVGHRNGDPLDCRRENLFMRNKQEQGRGNSKIQSRGGQPCSSRFKGVCFDKQTGRWRVGIVVDGKNRCLGRFRDEVAAAQAYDEAARELFGEYARLNFPDGIDAWLKNEQFTSDERAAA